jgi:hypothetical protein
VGALQYLEDEATRQLEKQQKKAQDLSHTSIYCKALDKPDEQEIKKMMRDPQTATTSSVETLSVDAALKKISRGSQTESNNYGETAIVPFRLSNFFGIGPVSVSYGTMAYVVTEDNRAIKNGNTYHIVFGENLSGIAMID